jgi:sugar O-acyltransferase (sialic acid O-acetyltransferase NeuD family)
VRIVLYAVSTPHASELVETTNRLGWQIARAVRNRPGLPVPPEVEDPISADDLDPQLLALPFAVPQTNPAERFAAIADARARGFREALTMIDPTAIVAASVTVAQGVYVGAGAVIGAGTSIGDGCLVNRSCSVAHHVSVADHVTTGPGVVIAGMARLGSGAFIGAGAVVAPEISVGVGAVVGAGAVVIHDVGPGEVVVGNPARVLRRTEPSAGAPWA